MAPRRAEDIPLKRVAALGCRLPSRLPAGEILKDITDNLWRLGSPIGCGGFGDIYLASNELNKPVTQNAKFIIKIEPHSNGPLFVEMNFYIRAARKHMIEEWCKSKNLRQIGIPSYEGSGSHIYNGEKYRFLVIPRYGIDVDNLFLSNGRSLPIKLVNSLAVQMIYALEYIHSQGYAHADVKGSNILLKRNSSQECPSDLEKTQVFLVDYGLAYRYRTANGSHKPFLHDERRAHEGTLEYTSRDAHHGTHSRRSDLETLGYNLLKWLCGKLPWEEEDGGTLAAIDPEEVQDQKENFLNNVDVCMKRCFKNQRKIPDGISDYMKYIANLKFESRPDYVYLRNLFKQDVDFESLFGARQSIPNENGLHMAPYRRPYLRERKPCKPVNGDIRITRNTQAYINHYKKENDFSWEVVLACHPDKIAKICAQPSSSPLTPPPSPTPPMTIPTYAMVQVLQRMKEKQNGLVRQKSISKSSDNDLKPRWMTPAMEEIAQLIKKNHEAERRKAKRQIHTRVMQTRSYRLSKRKLEAEVRPPSKRRKFSH